MDDRRVAEPGNRRRPVPRLASWTPRWIAYLWLYWPAFVLALMAAALAVSYLVHKSLDAARESFTQANLAMLCFAVLAPPACLTLVWWRARKRRR